MRNRMVARMPQAAMPVRGAGELCDLCEQSTHSQITADSVWHLAFASPSQDAGPRAAATLERDLPRTLVISIEMEGRGEAAAAVRPGWLKAAVPEALRIGAGRVRYFLEAAILAVDTNNERYTCLVFGGGGLSAADFDDEALRTSASGGARTARKLKRVVLAHYRRGDVSGLAERVQQRQDAERAAGGGADSEAAPGSKRARLGGARR
jgi:hypothetical protein